MLRGLICIPLSIKANKTEETMNNENIKKIGLWNIVGLGVGGAVGSGIFVTLGSAIEKTGRSILPITIICVFYMLLAYWYNLGMSGIFVIKQSVPGRQ